MSDGMSDSQRISSDDLAELFKRLEGAETTSAHAPEPLLTVYARLRVVRDPRSGQRSVSLDVASVDPATREGADLEHLFLAHPYERTELSRLSPEQIEHLLGRSQRFSLPNLEREDLHWMLSRERARQLGMSRKDQAASFDRYKAKLIVEEYPNAHARFQEVAKADTPSADRGGRRARKRARCLVCEHEASDAINGLLKDKKTPRAVARAYEIPEDAVERHVSHRSKFRWTSHSMQPDDLERLYVGVRWARASGMARAAAYELVAAAFREKIPARFGGKDRTGALRRLAKHGKKVHQGREAADRHK
jgi:hypothetical protein